MTAASDGLRRTLMVTFGVTLAGGIVLALLTIGYTLRLERELERRLRRTPGRAATCRSFRRCCCARRKTSAAPWRASCTTKSANRFPRS